MSTPTAAESAGCWWPAVLTVRAGEPGAGLCVILWPAEVARLVVVLPHRSARGDPRPDRLGKVGGTFRRRPRSDDPSCRMGPETKCDRSSSLNPCCDGLRTCL